MQIQPFGPWLAPPSRTEDKTKTPKKASEAERPDALFDPPLIAPVDNPDPDDHQPPSHALDITV